MVVNIPKFSKTILRVGLSFVFLYFGFQMITKTDSWAGLIPKFLTGTIITANNWVILNGIMELTLGTFLLIGLYTRFSSLILSIHLIFITINMGFTPTGARDFGLMIATFVVFLNGIDEYTIDNKILKKN